MGKIGKEILKKGPKERGSFVSHEEDPEAGEKGRGSKTASWKAPKGEPAEKKWWQS